MLTVILSVLFVAVLVLYLMRRRSRLRQEDEL